MNAFILTLVKIFSDARVIALIMSILEVLVKRTSNTLDDQAVEIVELIVKKNGKLDEKTYTAIKDLLK